MSSFKVRTSFAQGRQSTNLTIRPKHKGLQLVIPGVFNSEDPERNKRIVLTFNTAAYDISPAF